MTLRHEEIDRVRRVKEIADEILSEPAGELRHQFAERLLAAIKEICNYHRLDMNNLDVAAKTAQETVLVGGDLTVNLQERTLLALRGLARGFDRETVVALYGEDAVRRAEGYDPDEGP